MNTLDRYSPITGILLVMFTFLLAGLIAAAGREQARVEMVQPTAPLPILYLPTAEPTAPPAPTADTRAMEQEIQTLKAKVAELEAERAAPAAEQQIVLVQAAPTIAPPTPAPTAEPTEAPRLQTFVMQPDEEPLSPALMREAMDR